MNTYRRCFAAVAILLTAPCAALFFIGFLSGRYTFVGIALVLPIVFWYLYWLLLKRRRYAFALSFAVAAFLWIPLLFQTGKRLDFMGENDGFELGNGDGSPMLFVIGAAIEQAFFIPLSLVIVVGTWHLLRGGGKLSGGPKA